MPVIQGLDELISKLNQARKELPRTVGGVLYQFAEEVMSDSKEIVPVKTGALMNTGQVASPVYDINSVEVTMGYGDTAVDYAIIVHEELDSPGGTPINWTRPGSGPKYLENPLKAKQDQLPVRVGDAVKELFKV